MTNPTEEQLLYYNNLGIIPGPDESPIDFIKRGEYCLSLKNHLSEELKTNLGTSHNDSSELLKDGFVQIKHLYDFSPTWIPVFFSNYQLTPWHGGCAWIFQMSNDTPTAALLQLRKSLIHSPKYLGLYHRQELVSHELAHIGRMMFNEPMFEEMLTYHSSPSKFRRWFGPILQSSTESMLFVVVLSLIIFIDIFLLSFGSYQMYLSAIWLKLIPIAMIGWAMFRLWNKHHYFKSCLNSLSTCLHDKSKATHVIYRLKDSEIIQFSKMNPAEIKEYATIAARNSLRWQAISTAYFSS